MRFHGVGVLLPLLISAAAWALPDGDVDSARETRRAQAHLEKGRDERAAAVKQSTGVRRLASLDRAIYFLRRAHEAASKARGAASAELRAETVRELVRALEGQAEQYLARSAPKLARKRSLEAFLLAPDDPRIRELSVRIQDGEAAGAAPVPDRRLAAGVLLRDRGAERRK